MKKVIFGHAVTAVDVERLPADTGPTDFVRLCGALIGKALADRVGSFTLPEISERINVPDGGVDAEYTTPEALPAPETGGLIGPGKTAFQFKYRDASATNRSAIVQKLVQKLREDFPRVAPRCDRYVLMTNVQLSGAQSRRLRDALVESFPAFTGKQIVIWGAAEIANALNSTPYLRHLFFSEGGLCTLDIAEAELKAAYGKIGWPPFTNRAHEVEAIATFLRDGTARVLQVVGPKYVGKTRLVIEALKRDPSSVLWAASPDYARLDVFRDFDSSDAQNVLVVDRCDEFSLSEILEWAQARQRLKTIIIREGSALTGLLGATGLLAVEPLESQDAWKLIEAIARRTMPFLQQSWLKEATGNIPGLVLHVAAVIKEAQVSASASPDEIQSRLGDFLEERYASRLSPEARQALEAASLLPVLGIRGEAGREIDALSRAMNLSADTLRRQLPELERRGLVRWRGRFIEVIPPRLAEHLASAALAHPEKILAELELALEPGSFLRFLERFRNLPNQEVKSAIGRLFSPSGWFPDINSLPRNAKRLEIMAPAAPVAALQCIERLLATLSADALKAQLVEEARRALVWTLQDLALRSETFEGAARQLLALAEAENETWGNNATGVFLPLFHWRHPEVSASLSRRLGVLEEDSRSASPVRRRIVTAACGRAFEEYVSFTLHHPKGPTLPEQPYRPETWDELRGYATGILDLLTRLLEDGDFEVKRTATSSFLKSFRPFVVSLSLAPEGLHSLGKGAFAILEKIGRTTESAHVRADVLSQLELILESLRKSDLSDRPATIEAIQLADRLYQDLTSEGFRDRLWRWVGPRSWGLRRRLTDDAEALAQIQTIASELSQNPRLFDQHLDWLTGEEAKYAPVLFQMLGKEDKGGALFQRLLTRSKQPAWPQAFSAYVWGWFQSDPKGAEDALDHLADTRPDLVEGILRATCFLPPSDKAITRLLRLLAKSPESGSEMVSQIALFMRWEQLPAGEAERLISALDDGTQKARSLLLSAFATRIFRGGEMTASLKELAWSFLHSSLPGQDDGGGHDWDTLAAALGKEQPERLLHLLEGLAIEHLTAGHRRLSWEYELPLVWETLQERDRQGCLRMLLRLVMTADVPYSIDWTLSQMIDPSRDRELLLQFSREAGNEGARTVALNLDVNKPGFWELARDLIGGWGDDDRVKERLLSQLMGGSWSGSAVPMISARIESAKKLLADSNPKVAQWAREAVSSLEAWRRQEEREDQEEWIWDYRIRRTELEAMVRQKDSPERLWAIGRLLKDAPKDRVLELLTPAEILEALPKLDQIDERTRQKWEAYARHWSESH